LIARLFYSLRAAEHPGVEGFHAAGLAGEALRRVGVDLVARRQVQRDVEDQVPVDGADGRAGQRLLDRAGDGNGVGSHSLAESGLSGYDSAMP
jgi:hypothetical protein